MAGEALLAQGRIAKLEKALADEGIAPNPQALAEKFEPRALSLALIAKGLLTEQEINEALLPLIAEHMAEMLKRVQFAKRPHITVPTFRGNGGVS